MVYYTKAVDYAIRALVCLAKRPHESMDVKAIARQEELPEVFLAKLLQKMKKAGLITSKRGVGGGFVLDRNAVNISVMEIIESVEGSDGAAGKIGDGILEKRIWHELHRKIEEHLRSTTVARLVADAEVLG